MSRLNDTQLAEAKAALKRLVSCCSHKSGQGYKLRGLLYSLWNGKPYSLLNVVGLDADLLFSLLIVMAGFGSPGFFYDEVKAAFVEACLFDWFIEEGGAS